MNNQTSTSFQSFTGSISKLDHTPTKPSCCSTSADKFSNSNNEGKLSSAFDPFQEKLSQQYSLSGQDTSKILSEFVEMLEEALTNVKNGFDAKSNQTSENKVESVEDNNTVAGDVAESKESESCSGGCPYSG